MRILVRVTGLDVRRGDVDNLFRDRCDWQWSVLLVPYFWCSPERIPKITFGVKLVIRPFAYHVFLQRSH